MIALMLLASLAQDPVSPRRPEPRPPQDDLRREADEIRARLDDTDDPEERARLMAQLARLEAHMRGRVDVEDFATVEKKMMALFKEHDLDLGDLKESKPEEYREMLIGAWHMTRGPEHASPEWRDLQEELMVAEVRIQLLSSAYRGEEGHGSAEIEKKIHSAVDELFDLRVKLREMELAELEARMEEIRTRLATQKENKKMLVEQRVKELTGKRKDLEFP